ncbi:probable ATP-dependent RNA helicase spindle-E [Topomyia yanbarensis]|uniref:probable ATP-dependent RNA helicase spindle-E n=1 Tax=Topomyia yanbarensis TaxID=2498891 RepID=UPI00273ABDDC|nr:probable ATP-dependent RNA helicase spindle-E [Topomyia yanbarensis]XP_058836205.1 probable ATP-dependent RNA helicase spindle-E [Topomyia yanbarensis]
MDDIDDFFDFSKPFNRVVISGGYCNATVVEDKSIFAKMPEREKLGKEYVGKFVKEEESQLISAFLDEAAGPSTSRTSNLEDVDDETSMADEDEEHTKALKAKEMMAPLFQRYNFVVKPGKLPIRFAKDDILEKIRTNAVVILQGPTGCGKTTQVPQYILEEAYQRKEYCNIIVTQPRKIAAMSIANRVADERKCRTGELVGYKVGLKECVSPDTRLLYVTTGVLLQSLITSKSMANYTHVILDEIHERDVDIDFLLIIVRRLLATNSTKTKVILMSATIDAKVFSEYFKIPKKSGYLSAPILSVDKPSQFRVKDYYLDDLDKLKTDFTIDFENPGISPEMYKLASKLVFVCDRLLEDNDNEERILAYKPSIIIFLPGINEIEQMYDSLMGMMEQTQHKSETNLKLIKLHSTMPTEEQVEVFRRPAPGQRKVILSTNIAESSITVPDIKFVIDFCLQRLQYTESSTNFNSLRTQWASHSNCEQRRGRAGRVMDGRVYRLVTRRYYEHQMKVPIPPEMLRCPLDAVVLKAKLLEMGPPHSILALAMNPPDLSDIRNTVLQLKEMGALLSTVNGNYEQLDGDLTCLGRVMAKLPIDLRMSKLIMLGYVFSVLEEAIIIAAGMNSKNIFLIHNNVRSYTQKMYWADGSGSDGIAILNAFIAWKSRKEQSGDGGDMASWTRRMSLDLKCLMDMAELIREIKDRLKRIGFKETYGPNRVVWSSREKTVILKVIMAGAFYPHYYVPMSVGGKELMERQSFTELGGRDPCNTVFFTGFDHERYIGSLYTVQIKNIISEGDVSRHQNMKVMFDRTTNRIFVTFLGSNDERDQRGSFMPGKVHSDVYRAIKLRKMGTRNRISELRTMRQKDAIEFATKLNLGHWEDANGWVSRRKVVKNAHLSVVPPIYRASMVCQVTHVVHCNKFHLRPEDSRNKDIFAEIHTKLNSNSYRLSRFDPEFHFSAGLMVAAPLQEGSDQYARAVLKSYKNMRRSGDVLWIIFFLDYGHTAVLGESAFRRLDGPLEYLKDVPQRVFEATLTEIQPSAIISPQGIWAAESINRFKEMTLGKIFIAEIYSVVNNVASVILRKGDELPINSELIRLKYAQYSEESYISKLDHDSRERKQREMSLDENMRMEVYRTAELNQNMYEEEELEDVSPPEEKLRCKVVLSGPHSPLETSASSTIQSGVMTAVTIEADSVNSVLLDSNPQDTHEKLLVAGFVNEQGNRLVLRQTSMMPNIPGFGALMALIFCPTCQLKKDADETRVVTILCGLGMDSTTGESLYPEHDMALSLDVVLTDDDISQINALRYTIDSILLTDKDQAMPKFNNVSIEKLKINIKSFIIKILEAERKFLDVRHAPNDYAWKTDLNASGGSSSKRRKDDLNIYKNAIFPLHEPLNLLPVSAKQIDFLKRHCRELHKLALTDVHLPRHGITCQMCNTILETLPQLRIHLYSKLHRDRESQIKFR